MADTDAVVILSSEEERYVNFINSIPILLIDLKYSETEEGMVICLGCGEAKELHCMESYVYLLVI